MSRASTVATTGRIAVTGARGRLGSALVRRLRSDGNDVVAWSRPDYDLDRPRGVDALLRRDRPAMVIHTAAWTDVDGCARDPALAAARNGTAVGALARACRRVGATLVFVSTNEVFDGLRVDGRGYVETDAPAPANPYGSSKLEGERQAGEAFRADDPGRTRAGLWIVRTAWLFGPGDPDFPRKILAAADALDRGATLPVVDDEIGSPTFASDLATGLLELVGQAPPGLYHLANRGAVSRFEWAALVLRRCRRQIEPAPIHAADFVRASAPPSWAVLDSAKAARSGVVMREWREAFEAYVRELCPR